MEMNMKALLNKNIAGGVFALLLILGGTYYAVNDNNEKELIEKIKKLKPIDIGNVEILNVRHVGDSYICRLMIKEGAEGRVVPALVSDDFEMVTIGNTYDTKTGFTIGAIEMKDYEKYEAFTIGGGSGTDNGGEFYIFTDPDCPICKQLADELSSSGLLKYTKIHVFFYPLESIHPESQQKCMYVLSKPTASERAQTFTNIQEGKDLAYKSYSSSDEVKETIQASKKLGDMLKLKGTPTIIDKGGVEVDTGVWISYLRALKEEKEGKAPQQYGQNQQQAPVPAPAQDQDQMPMGAGQVPPTGNSNNNNAPMGSKDVVIGQ